MRKLAWWPKSVAVRTPIEYQLEAEACPGRPEIAEFSRRHVLGTKFAAMMCEAARGVVFWCDVDILFFQDLLTRTDGFSGAKPPLCASEDWLCGYDQRLARTIEGELHAMPWVNSGLVWMRGDVFKEADLAPALAFAIGGCNHFTEQTLIALATARVGKVLWTRKQILLDDSDQYDLRMPRYGASYLARHYLTPHRHLFWRDAMALRLRGMP